MGRALRVAKISVGTGTMARGKNGCAVLFQLGLACSPRLGWLERKKTSRSAGSRQISIGGWVGRWEKGDSSTSVHATGVGQSGCPATGGPCTK